MHPFLNFRASGQCKQRLSFGHKQYNDQAADNTGLELFIQTFCCSLAACSICRGPSQSSRVFCLSLSCCLVLYVYVDTHSYHCLIVHCDFRLRRQNARDWDLVSSRSGSQTRHTHIRVIKCV